MTTPDSRRYEQTDEAPPPNLLLRRVIDESAGMHGMDVYVYCSCPTAMLDGEGHLSVRDIDDVDPDCPIHRSAP